MGREVLGYLLDSARVKDAGWRVGGFLDDNPGALDGFNYDYKVVGSISDYTPKPNERLVCALGSPELKAKVCPELKERGAQFISAIHPTAIIGCNAVIGEGVVTAPHAIINADAVVGDFVFLNCFSACGHDAQIGHYSTLSSYCDITSGVRLGQRVFAGSHASVIPGRHIGDGVHIGAGSVVIRHIADGQRVFGVPAKTFM